MDRRRPITIFITVLLLTALLCACTDTAAEEPVQCPLPAYYAAVSVTPGSSRQFEVNDVPVRVTEFRDELHGDAVLDASYYELDNGDTVFAGSLRSETGGDAIPVFETVCRSMELRFFRGGEWHRSSQKGIYRSGCLFLDTDEGSYILYLPQGYEHIENGCIRVLKDAKGWMDVRKTADGMWKIALYAMPPGENASSDFFLCRTDAAAIDWEDDEVPALWQILTNDGAWRMLYDGYYYESAANYEPWGDDVYANRPACYLAWVYARHAAECPIMDTLNCFVLDRMIRCQNEEGYWPSNSRSRWLYAKYSVNAGYYDTRFNSDLMETLLTEYRRSSWPELENCIEAYFDFYLQFAEQYGWSPESGGLFVPDYYETGMWRPHTSLNHQLAEISVLLKGGALLKRSDLTDLGLQMLAAIEGSEEHWIREDGNLEYAIYPGGVYGGTDYPFLTYNDLHDLQKTLRKCGLLRSSCLQRLMASKKVWMDAHGVTGYVQ